MSTANFANGMDSHHASVLETEVYDAMTSCNQKMHTATNNILLMIGALASAPCIKHKGTYSNKNSLT